MRRNKLIYAPANNAVVDASDVEKGGTWAGAIGALRAKWVPEFSLVYLNMPEGNFGLLKKGGIAFTYPFFEDFSKLPIWLQEHESQIGSKSLQLGLF